jgi:D-glycero-D-manno-heptose 1,7-bisphosphate phosphatase
VIAPLPVITSRPEAVLLDRDGTINVKAPEGEYITRPEQLELLPGAAEAIRALNRASVPAIIVTNQRGIARGRMTEDDLAEVHRHLRKLLSDHDARVDRIFYCPHEKGVCACRKPGILLLERARDYLGLASLSRSVMIGDSPSDVLAGRAAGARTLLLSQCGHESTPAGVEVASSLLDAVQRTLVSPTIT